jgi:hypothetical protein
LRINPSDTDREIRRSPVFGQRRLLGGFNTENKTELEVIKIYQINVEIYQFISYTIAVFGLIKF